MGQDMTAATPLQAQTVVLVTGPSGAGRSTAIHALEDLGFEAIDNLPLRLLPPLLAAPGARAMALGIDTRNRDFSTAGLLRAIDQIAADPAMAPSLLYLDARPEVLLRRYSETRRRHPLAPAESPSVGVERELDLLADLRDRADTLIDTSDLNVHDLRAEIARMYGPDREGGALAVSVQSFSYRRGMPAAADMVFDCRFLTNPYWNEALRPHDGRDAEVAEYIAADPRHGDFLSRVLDLVRSLLPAYIDEGKSHLSIAFGCTGGQHRSVAVAETVAKALAEDGRRVSIRHRELERRGTGVKPG